MKSLHFAFVIFSLQSFICLSGCNEGNPGTVNEGNPGTVNEWNPGTVTFHLADAKNPSFDLKIFQNIKDAANETFLLERKKSFEFNPRSVGDISEGEYFPRREKEITSIDVDDYLFGGSHDYSEVAKPQLNKRSPKSFPYSIQKAPLRNKITKNNKNPDSKSYFSFRSEQPQIYETTPKYENFDGDEYIIASPESSYSERNAYSNHRRFHPSEEKLPLFQNLGPNFYGLEKNIALSNGQYIPVSSVKITGVPYEDPPLHPGYAEEEKKSKITFTDLLRINDDVSPSIELSSEDKKELETILSELAKTKDSLVINMEILKKSEQPKSLAPGRLSEEEFSPGRLLGEEFSLGRLSEEEFSPGRLSEEEFSLGIPNSTHKRNKLEDILEIPKSKDVFSKQLKNGSANQPRKLNLKESEEITEREITSKESIQSKSSGDFRRRMESNLNSERLTDSLKSFQKLPVTELETDLSGHNSFNKEQLKVHNKDFATKIKSLENSLENKDNEQTEGEIKKEEFHNLEEKIKSTNQEKKELFSEKAMKLETHEKQMISENATVTLNKGFNNSINAFGADERNADGPQNKTEHKSEDGNRPKDMKTAKALLFSTNAGVPLPILAINSTVANLSNFTQALSLDFLTANVAVSGALLDTDLITRKKSEVDQGEFGDIGKVNETTVSEVLVRGIINNTKSVKTNLKLSPESSNISAIVVMKRNEDDSSEEEIRDLLFSPRIRESMAENRERERDREREGNLRFPSMLVNPSSNHSADEVGAKLPEILSPNAISSTSSTLSELASKDSTEKSRELGSEEEKFLISSLKNISKETEALHSYLRSLPPVPSILKKHFEKLKRLAASSLEKLISSEENQSEGLLLKKGNLRDSTKTNVNRSLAKFNNNSPEISDDEAESHMRTNQSVEEDVSEELIQKKELISKCEDRTTYVTADITKIVTSTLLEFIRETVSRSSQLSTTLLITETKTNTNYQTIFQQPEQTVTVTTTVGVTSDVFEPRKIQIVVTENPIHVLTNVHVERFTQIYTDSSKVKVVDLVSTTLVEFTQFSLTTIVETQFQTSEIFSLNTITEFVTVTILKPSPMFYTVTTVMHESNFLTVTKTELITKYSNASTNLATLNVHLDSTSVVTVTQYSTICDQNYRFLSFDDKEDA